ncbi:MAG: hypothetical protein GY952_11605 [Rhodobacteraceae bacterium]|nr:hypothetical protein [Paracoccaceae bacterium]
MALAFGPSTATAGPITGLGIQFDRMPVGTKAYYDSTDNGKWVDVYTGKKRGLYVMKRYKGHNTRGRLVSTVYFDAKGRRTHYTGPRGLRVVFTPYDCDYQFEPCQYKIKIRGEAYVENGKSSTYTQSTKKEKGQYVATWYRGTEKDNKGGRLFKLGKYNLRSKVQYFSKGMQTVNLVKVE